jgi:hypothetical protein
MCQAGWRKATNSRPRPTLRFARGAICLSPGPGTGRLGDVPTNGHAPDRSVELRLQAEGPPRSSLVEAEFGMAGRVPGLRQEPDGDRDSKGDQQRAREGGAQADHPAISICDRCPCLLILSGHP